MGRPRSDVRVSLKCRGGPTTRVELVLLLDGRWQVRRNGRLSATLPSGTTTEVAAAIRRWLAKAAGQVAAGRYRSFAPRPSLTRGVPHGMLISADQR